MFTQLLLAGLMSLAPMQNARADALPQTEALMAHAGQFKRSGGTIDFVAALNDRLNEGVTPENNAAVAVLFTMPKRDIEAQSEWYSEALKRLNVQRPDSYPHFVSFDEFTEGDSAAESELELATQRPWTADEAPRVAQWLKQNRQAMAKIEDASRKPRFYVPFMDEPGEPEPVVIEVRLPHLSHLQAIRDAFVARANRHCAERRLEQAWTDIMTLKLLARCTAREPTSISALVAINLDNRAFTFAEHLAESKQLTPVQATTAIMELQNLPELPSVDRSLHLFERFMILDGAQDLRAFFAMTGEPIDTPPERRHVEKLQQMYDPQEAMNEVNQEFDELVRISIQSDYQSTKQQLDAFTARLDKRRVRSSDGLMHLSAPEKIPEEEVQQTLTDAVICVGLPSLDAVIKMQWIAECQHDLTRIALALGGYHAEHERWPASLDELAPELLDEIPADRFTDDPLHYRVDGDSAAVWSVGPNLTNDEGDSRNDVGFTLTRPSIE